MPIESINQPGRKSRDFSLSIAKNSNFFPDRQGESNPGEGLFSGLLGFRAKCGSLVLIEPAPTIFFGYTLCSSSPKNKSYKLALYYCFLIPSGVPRSYNEYSAKNMLLCGDIRQGLCQEKSLEDLKNREDKFKACALIIQFIYMIVKNGRKSE